MTMFSIGDVVRLNSGGPEMTVIDTWAYKDESTVTCKWLDQFSRPQCDTFPTACVKLVQGGTFEQKGSDADRIQLNG